MNMSDQDKIVARYNRLMRILNDMEVSFEIGAQLAGRHPAAIRKGIMDGSIRQGKTYKKKMSLNAWDCFCSCNL